MAEKRQEKVREKIFLLLQAGTHWETIRDVTGASRTTIFKVKKKFKSGNTDIKRKSRGPPKNKVLTED